MTDLGSTIQQNGTECYQHQRWQDVRRGSATLKHGFFTARGGVSSGVYTSLNCGFGSNDNPDFVRQNRALAAESLGFGTNTLFGLRQIHSAQTIHIDETSNADSNIRPEADAMVTSHIGIALGILTADCVPVLFLDAQAGVLGAAHAGWRGAVDGVLAATIDAMVKAGARTRSIEAVIGPAIQQPSYQVGDELRATVLARHPEADQFFVPDIGTQRKYRFDLPGFVLTQLQSHNLAMVTNLSIDTYRESPKLFSHRRATHDAAPDSGRQISIIGFAL